MEGIDFVKYISALLFVITLISVLAWVARRFFMSSYTFGKLQTERHLKILESKSIDPKRRLLIIDWDGDEYLLILGTNSEQIIAKKSQQKGFEKRCHKDAA